ncbi:helix-turn-helix domain-containing protein [Cognataquiflexum aquatile]|uniref:helix-turn-helix domain-containing protein n=1 Tax=Cognataquiflexum aquatile TaxID=2249427 RepID=UPI000DEB5238|nr:helix-turn-helix domain-containing protein [Cognataquiflexum aquatile]
MEIIFNFDTVLFLASAAVGILSGAIILYFGFKYNPANQPLGFGQLCLGLAIWSAFIFTSGLIIYLPHWYRTSNIFTMLFIPMSFLYVVFFTQNRSWKWYDFLHFIPVMIYIVDYWSIFMLSGEEKKLLIQQGLSDLDFLREFRDSRFFGPHFHWEFRTAQFSLYWLAEVAIFVKWLRIQGPLTRQVVQRRNWILVILGCHLAMVIVHYLSLFATIDLLIISGLFVTLGTSITLVIFFYPSILYGSYLSEKPQLTPKIQPQIIIKEEEKQKMEEMYLKMEAFLEEKKNFLNEGYTVHDFSQDIVIPPYQISKILRTVLNIGFVDYINQKRIKYCIDKLDQETWNTYTLEAVATECGFSNRNTFTQAFIKFQGETPSVYRSKVKKIKRS